MNHEMLIVGSIAVIAVVLFVTEWLRADTVALIVMLGLALTGILSGEDVIAGFSNEAVITIASVLILSGGLMRTGVANFIGDRVLAAAGASAGKLTVVMMTTVGLLSGIMNDIGITALMLPVVMEMSRKIRVSPSKLLMPLAFGSLLGGMTTMIGTAPNILVNSALKEAGKETFSMFSFAPIGLAALGAGILYMSLLGRRLLPDRDLKTESAPDLESLYGLGSLIGSLTLPPDSGLIGKTLRATRLGHALGLHAIAIRRDGHLNLAPGPDFLLQAGDELVVEGMLERFKTLRAWPHLQLESTEETLDRLKETPLEIAELVISAESPLIGKSLRKAKLGGTYHIHPLAIARGEEVIRIFIRGITIEEGDRILVAVPREYIPTLKENPSFLDIRSLTDATLSEQYHLDRRIQSVIVTEESFVAGRLLADAQIADTFGLTIVGLLRDGSHHLAPEPHEVLEVGDVLLLRGLQEDFAALESLQELQLTDLELHQLSELESDEVGLVEASLSPRTTFAGKSVEELKFREKYGVSILAVWRNGKVYRSEFAEMELLPGDAFLLYGSRKKLALLAGHPDFLVFANGHREETRTKKAPVSALIMLGVLASVVSGLLPIYIAAPTGALLMVLTGCLKMEEAYRSIELKAILLIAGMLSLGLAMQESGTAMWIADSVLGRLAEFGPLAVVAGLFLITALSAQLMPTAAVAVLMAPIALSISSTESLSPYALMMTVAIASSCAFMSPVGHPVNLLVMGFGGYRFVDFIKVGFPLFLLVMAVVLLVLPLFFPLTLP